MIIIDIYGLRNDKSVDKSAAIITDSRRIRFRERLDDETPGAFRTRLIQEARSIGSCRVILGFQPSGEQEPRNDRLQSRAASRCRVNNDTTLRKRHPAPQGTLIIIEIEGGMSRSAM